MSSDRDTSSSTGELDRALDRLDREGALPDLGHLVHHERSDGSVELVPGSVLGEFHLESVLGRGGMGIVFRATQASVPGREVAVKVMRSPLGEQRRFLREIAIVGSLDHEGIVPIVAAGVERGVAYFAMRYVHGVPVSRLIRRLRAERAFPPDAEGLRRLGGQTESDEESPSSSGRGKSAERTYCRWAARVVQRVADALQYAHEQGIVHRDVKPGNIILTPEGRPVLVDFGLASGLEDDEALTRPDEFVGTLADASPEQLRGELADGRSDVYSLGATLHEILSLARPFGSGSREELRRKIETTDPEGLPRWVSADLRTISQKALSAEPRHRYASPGQMGRDLRDFLAGQPISSRPPGILRRIRRTVRRHPQLTLAASVALLFLLGVSVLDRWKARSAVLGGTDALDRAQVLHERYEVSLREYQSIFDDRGEDAYWASIDRADRIAAALGHLEVEIAAELGEAERAFQRSFVHVRNHGGGRRGLASVWEVRTALARLRCEDVWNRDAFAALLRSGGSEARPGTRRVELRSVPDDATLELVPGTRTVPDSRSTISPGQEVRLPEGSHAARFIREGHLEARLPFLIRPGEQDEEVLRLQVTMIPDHPALEGFCHVPGGKALVADDPPRWSSIPDFLIQRTEVRLRDWVRYLNSPYASRRARSPASFAGKPRHGDGIDQLHVRWDPSGEAWSIEKDFDADWPVRGLNWNDLVNYAYVMNRMSPPPPGWYFSLPTEHEWIRAARGADGRRHPWGDEFDWSRCAGYRSRRDLGREQGPYRVDGFPGDVSPFGVLGLAGSVHEATTGGRLIRGQHVYLGGSFQSVLPEEMSVLHRTALAQTPTSDAGLRLVLRRLPPELVAGAEPEWSLSDDFERKDGATLGHGWLALANKPLRPPDSVPLRAPCVLEDGALVLLGGEGNSSNRAVAHHTVRTPSSDFRVTLILDALEGTASPDRGFSVVLQTDLFEPEGTEVRLGLSTSGVLSLRRSGAPPTADDGAFVEQEIDVTHPLRLELIREGTRIEARVSTPGTERPGMPVLRLDMGNDVSPFRHLTLEADNFIGARVEIDEVAVSAP